MMVTAAMLAPSVASTEIDRQWIIDLIHTEYDPAPSHFRDGDDWDDGASRIADTILAAVASAPLPSHITTAIDHALRWHPSNGGPSYDEARRECLRLANASASAG